jgi:hypothetical protein
LEVVESATRLLGRDKVDGRFIADEVDSVSFSDLKLVVCELVLGARELDVLFDW